MSSFDCHQDFREIWRFEEPAALMEKARPGAITFFDDKQSNALWSLFISPEARHLMTMSATKFNNTEKYKVSFGDRNSADALFAAFRKRAGSPDVLILFFGSNSACILEFDVLQAFWNEIFLISDETTIAADANSKTVLFSFEESFFIAER